jgi:hypothetical protein
MSAPTQSKLRRLPSVDALLHSAGGAALVERYGHALTTEALRGALDDGRAMALSDWQMPCWVRII